MKDQVTRNCTHGIQTYLKAQTEKFESLDLDDLEHVYSEWMTMSGTTENLKLDYTIYYHSNMTVLYLLNFQPSSVDSCLLHQVSEISFVIICVVIIAMLYLVDLEKLQRDML